MNRSDIEIGKHCFFCGKQKGKDIIKQGVIVGPWNKEFPGYIGINDLTRGGFCYIEASRLFYSISELRFSQPDERYGSVLNEDVKTHIPGERLRVISRVSLVEDTAKGMVRAVPESRREKIRVF